MKKGAEGPLLMRESEEGRRGEIERGRAGGRDREKRDREMREEMWKERENKREGRKTDSVDGCTKTIFI